MDAGSLKLEELIYTSLAGQKTIFAYVAKDTVETLVNEGVIVSYIFDGRTVKTC